MKTQRKSRFRPRHDRLESRCLLSSAVVDIQNDSAYDITFAFPWSPPSTWTLYSEAPGQSQLLSTPASSSLAPQVLYDQTPSPYSEVDVSLAQGYGEWSGSGSPPASAATTYAFLNTWSGVTLYNVPTP